MHKKKQQKKHYWSLLTLHLSPRPISRLSHENSSLKVIYGLHVSGGNGLVSVVL